MNFLNKLFSNSNASTDVIYTIDREHGTGAFEIASILAKKLNIEVYDEDIIELKTLESRVDLSNVKKDDTFLQGTVYDLYRENYSYSQEDITSNDAQFLANSKTIRDLAKKGACVMMGKCANYVLSFEKVFNVFLTAPEDYRLEKIKDRYSYDEEKAKNELKKIDARRRNHYQKYTPGQWSYASEYDITIDVSKFSNSDIANIILRASELKKY
ncbi:Cytidylate kinase [Peptoniphilus asaccharolyticus DSM 20463]|uniref:Cytidylate kinase n=1 Tax=Peptoniphilus asaccharolyticus DSM 20463 TaxID=573058 RepID=A0A1W1V5H4_PEPAS|nr:cytidylate kinase-like family protein [Peptoniphilus asaccharolyticus]MBL7576357.1 cytidylate kinase-like family protein [Peptoniphilus asaccharolyticus]SMB88535.1 Cytidylate kinase [Peptoniphilus asaccharolyticus DSM 20463]